MPFSSSISRLALIHDLHRLGISFEQDTWVNYMESIESRNAIIVQVDNEDQVKKLILAVKKQNDMYPANKITIRSAAGWKNQVSCPSCFNWSKEQVSTYAHSYSFSPGVVADVIIRFSKKFQYVKAPNPSQKLPSTIMEVSAGVQIAELATKLKAKNLSLPTVSMIPWVSAVGLVANCGHGTGRDLPAFSGLIHSMKICDMDGKIREINESDPNFETLCAAHVGMLGIVLSIQIKTVELFKLEETVLLYKSLEPLKAQLSDLLHVNQYFTLMRLPTYPHPLEALVDKWQLRLWNKTTEERSENIQIPFYPNSYSLGQELSTRIGGSILNLLIAHENLHELIPMYMLLAAGIVTSSRGTAPRIGYEYETTHSQAASLPKDMRDVSYMVPVEDELAGDLLSTILQKIDELLAEAASRHEYPVNYAIYVRYLKGTNGGLSSTSTSSTTQRILAIDIVTDPDAPGITRFEFELMSFFASIDVKPRHHLGKNFPFGVKTYADFLDAEALALYRTTLVEQWYGGQDKFDKSPFVTSYGEEMLFSAPSAQATLMPVQLEDRAIFKKLDEVARVQLDCLLANILPLQLPRNLEPVRLQFVEQLTQKLLESGPRQKLRA